MTMPKQCCGNCRFFTHWDRTPYGICSWNLPTPAHIRRYGSALMVAQPGHDFGEDCPAWEKGTPKVSPTKFSKTKTKTKK
jgi:hypothetical protein